MRRPKSRRRSEPRRCVVSVLMSLVSLACQSSRAQVTPTCISGATSVRRSRPGIALLELEMPSDPITGQTTCPSAVVVGSTPEAAMPHTTIGQWRSIAYRFGRVFTISRLRRGTIAVWLCTTTTASSGPALRTRYHMPRLSGPGTATTKRAHRSQGDDPSPCPAPALTGPLSPTSRETARSVRSIIPDRPRIGKTGLTLGMHAPSWTARSPVGASTEWSRRPAAYL